MINFIGILVLLIIEATLIWTFFKWTNENKEIEIEKSRQSITQLREIIKSKNLKIKELENEIQRRNDRKSRKIY